MSELLNVKKPADIFRQEKILQAPNEKNKLLDISRALASVRKQVDLFQVIREKILPLFNLHNLSILVVRSDGYFYDLAESVPVNDLPDGQRSYGQGAMAFAGSTLEKLISRLQESGHPLIFDYSEDYSLFADGSLLTQFRSAGYTQGLACLMKVEGRTFGCFRLNSREVIQPNYETLSLFQEVADMLSVAVSNILANEALLERQREKSLLLSLSEDMATIRDRNDLWQVMMQKIKPLVNFDDAVVVVYDKERKRCNHLLTFSPPSRRANAHYQSIVEKWTPMSDTVVEYLVNRPGHYTWSTQELLTLYPEYPGLKLMEETGLNFTMHYKLNWAGTEIGYLHFHFNHKEQFNVSLILVEELPIRLPLRSPTSWPTRRFWNANGRRVCYYPSARPLLLLAQPMIFSKLFTRTPKI